MVFQAVSDLRRGIAHPGRRSTLILNLLSNHLDQPGVKEQLEIELNRAPHNVDSLDAERRARQRLENYTPLFPKQIRLVKPRKPKAKTKINAVLRIDPEMARLSVALRESPVFRLWAVARNSIRQTLEAGKADNYVTADNLYKALKSSGIVYTRSNYRGLLKRGQRLAILEYPQ